MMDVAYIYRDFPRQTELRFSLRSLKNYPHDRVWIAGDCPEWVRGVHHLPVEQSPARGDKHPNAMRSLRALLAAPELSDPFVLFNDDFFIMKAVGEIQTYHYGYSSDVLANVGPGRLGGTHYRSMEWTRDFLRREGFDEPICYQLHVPMIVHKGEYLQAMDDVELEGYPVGIWPQHMTIYGNRVGLGGEQLDADVKAYFRRDGIQPRAVYASTSDEAWRVGRAGRQIRLKFRHPGPYEREGSEGNIDRRLERRDNRLGL